MMTLFTDTERLVRYLQDNGVRIIRHTASAPTGMDGETVDFIVPPECQGLIEVVAYGQTEEEGDDREIIIRTTERDTGSVEYETARMVEGETFEPWNRAPETE
jgi:hypothetical protein